MPNTPTFFDFAAEVGITKHLGGCDATDELMQMCHIGNDTRVLDVGCGVGVTLCSLARRYHSRAIGVDLQGGMIRRSEEKAKREGVIDSVGFALANAQALPFEDNFFDAVISESVTAFLEDKHKAVNEYVRVTKPGGYVGLSEATWLKIPPPPELTAWASQDLGASIEPLTASQWAWLLESAGMGDVAAETRTINVQTERKRLLRQYGWGEMLKVLYRELLLYASSSAYRGFVKAIRENKITPVGLEEHFGYGLYVGRK
ncbi:MAG: methyltransferase domain-containing protein [Anaerolineae bacterium]